MDQSYSSSSSHSSSSDRGGGGGGGSRQKSGYLKRGRNGRLYADYKEADELRRCLTANGKLLSRKRLGTSAGEQRMVSQAVKQARYMALLPYTSATL